MLKLDINEIIHKSHWIITLHWRIWFISAPRFIEFLYVPSSVFFPQQTFVQLQLKRASRVLPKMGKPGFMSKSWGFARTQSLSREWHLKLTEIYKPGKWLRPKGYAGQLFRFSFRPYQQNFCTNKFNLAGNNRTSHGYCRRGRPFLQPEKWNWYWCFFEEPLDWPLQTSGTAIRVMISIKTQ